MKEIRKIQSLERGMKVLEAVVEHGNGIGVYDLSEKVGLGVNTTSSIVRTMMALGYVSQAGRGGKYSVGKQQIRLAAQTLQNSSVIHAARPFMRELFDRFNETIHLGILMEKYAMDIDVIESSHSIRAAIQVGHTMQLHCSALGKVVVAWMDEDHLIKMLDQYKFNQLTENTITSKDAFLEELKLIRQRGYAFNRGESEEELRCISVPIMGYSKNEVLAGISISMPSSRYNAEREQVIIPFMKKASVEISKRMGV